MIYKGFLFIIQFFLLVTLAAQNVGLSLNPVFADGSVWQRNQVILLKGAAPAGAVITFSSEDFGESIGVADQEGAWQMKLRAHEAGGPYGATLNMKIKGKDVPGEQIRLQDIYIGDVYLLSGQSNMEWLVSNTNNGASASAKTNSLIRHFKVPLMASKTPKTELPYITWKYAQPGQTENFSAIGYYFAEALLEKNPGVPIGLINSSWGGSRIEAWLPEGLEVDTLGQQQHQPTRLYNAMVRPLRDVKVSGILWYQGESNSGNENETSIYVKQLKQLLAMFRKEVGMTDVPFFVIELPEWLPVSESNYQDYAHWAMMRQAQRSVLAEPNTSVAVTLGYGDTKDIHPKNKQPVGRMLADEAMRLVYGVEDGPRFSTERGVSTLSDALVVQFNNVGTGLKSSNGKEIDGFAIQGTDGKWYDAEATVQNKDRVRLVGPVGITFQAVSYAWSNNPDEANMVNGWGRAVSSFRMGINE